MTQSSQNDITPIDQLILHLQEVRTSLVDSLHLCRFGQPEQDVQDDILRNVAEDELEGTEICTFSLHDDEQRHWDETGNRDKADYLDYLTLAAFSLPDYIVYVLQVFDWETSSIARVAVSDTNTDVSLTNRQ